MISKLKEVNIEIGRNAFKVDASICPNCSIKMDKIIANMSVS